MNELLLTNSVVVSFFLFLIVFFSYKRRLKFLYITTGLGSVTSILNHGTSNVILKYLDRLTIVFCAFVYLYYILALDTVKMFISLFFITFAVSIYFYSKFTGSSLFQNVCHWTVLVLLILLSLR